MEDFTLKLLKMGTLMEKNTLWLKFWLSWSLNDVVTKL